MKRLLEEKSLLVALIAVALVFPFEHDLLSRGLPTLIAAFALVFAVILACAFRVAHHAEKLACKYGEPYGTLILTVAAVTVEVIMIVILMMNSEQPTLARDTIYSAIMLDINGIIGVAALIGGLRHREQSYNVDSSNSYISMILVAVGMGMLIPDFIAPAQHTVYSIFTIVVTLLLYGVFTRMQTFNHRYFFEYEYPKRHKREEFDADAIPGGYHAVLLIIAIILIGVLAEALSAFLSAGIPQLGLPAGLAGLLVALISASPEILTALRAAMQNRMQTAINIAFGATLATVLMTIPVVESISLFSDIPFDMGLTPLQAGMILLTMLTAMISFNDGETNALEGMVHVVLFLTFIMLIFLVPDVPPAAHRAH